MSPKPLTRNLALQHVVYKNRWRDVFDGTVPEGWQPTKSVSIVIPSYNSATLPFTLASIAAQDYPEDLLEVIVVDDGSEPPVELGEYAHPNTRVMRIRYEDGEGWGRANGTYRAIEASTGDIIYWVDSDMVLFRDNVRQHAKYAHFIPEAATIGHKGFIEAWPDFTPEKVYEGVKSGDVENWFDLSTLHKHWSLAVFDETDDLNDSAGRNYSTHMGACATVTREVYNRSGKTDFTLHLGEDTHIAYEIWQAGGVFIPVNEAKTFHLGPATIVTQGEAVAHHNNTYFAQRMPIPRYRRSSTQRQWTVPYVTAVVETGFDTAKYARACVDGILNSTESDVKVLLVGPWSQLTDQRRSVLRDPNNELYLVQEWYRNEGRVELVEEAPQNVAPSPYRIDVPVTTLFAPHTLDHIMRYVYEETVGVAKFFPQVGHDDDKVITVLHTPALGRALPYVSEIVTLDEALDAVWDINWLSSMDLGLADLAKSGLPARISGRDAELVALETELAAARKQIRMLENLKQPAGLRYQAKYLLGRSTMVLERAGRFARKSFRGVVDRLRGSDRGR